MTTAANPYEALARENKAAALAAWCRAQGIAPELLEVASDTEWRALALHAGVKVPSRQTRALVLAKLKEAI